MQELPTVRLSCFLDQFISTFNGSNHYIKFQDLKLSTKNSPCELFGDAQQGQRSAWSDLYWQRYDTFNYRLKSRLFTPLSSFSWRQIHILNLIFYVWFAVTIPYDSSPRDRTHQNKGLKHMNLLSCSDMAAWSPLPRNKEAIIGGPFQSWVGCLWSLKQKYLK